MRFPASNILDRSGAARLPSSFMGAMEETTRCAAHLSPCVFVQRLKIKMAGICKKWCYLQGTRRPERWERVINGTLRGKHVF